MLIGHNKVAKQLFNYFFKEIQKQPPEVQKQSTEVFWKKMYSKKFRKFHRETPVLESIFNKVADLLQVFKRETPTQAFFYEVYKTLKSTYFEEHLQMTASVGFL